MFILFWLFLKPRAPRHELCGVLGGEANLESGSRRRRTRKVGGTGGSCWASPLLFGGVGHLHSTILAGERTGWILQVRQAVPDSH